MSGELIKVLDAGDQLTLGALAQDIAAFDAHPHIGGTTSRVLDLLPDGSTAGWDKEEIFPHSVDRLNGLAQLAESFDRGVTTPAGRERSSSTERLVSCNYFT
ncbi:hypothetical protein [Micromonospora endolithica]|uniref:hypothetical protein n=1 Tax=Micromonospora endolithica TaxID=230091 RepID=UPI001EE03303|nr:hypothetical protein [Micromonospora endolithica]